MVFSSLTFLFMFLPAVLLTYYIVPKCCKNVVLFAFSLLFYAWGEPVYVGLMIFSTILDYTCGRIVEKYRHKTQSQIALTVSVCINLGLLCLFKYSGFLVEQFNNIFRTSIDVPELAMPIGISFYTFQTMSYTIDVYRGEVKAQKNILDFGTYVTLFPQLIAGPIVRYQTVAEQIDNRTLSFDRFGSGVKRFICGLGKKVLLANNIGLLWSSVSSTPLSQLSTVSAWLGIVAFGLQLYFDFSGYSDMAIGLGRMLGFDFVENFDYPYISQSITEFWRRWHMSLGTWFRDYVYIPLGGNRKGFAIQMRNIAVVWFLTGLWHGASLNFILWGVYYGILLVIEKLFLTKLLKKLPSVFRHIYAIICVLIGWVLFSFENMSDGLSYLKVMLGQNTFCTGDAIYQLLSYLPLIVICLIGATPLSADLWKKISHRLKACLQGVTEIVWICSVFFLCTAYLISGSYNPFLYFRF